jgi:thiol:disulfide interchange protein DsbG
MTCARQRFTRFRVVCVGLALVACAIAPMSARAAATSTSAASSRAEYSRLFGEVQKADFVQEGAAPSKALLYVFFDANCYYCHLTWKALQPYERVGLQVRWIPVSYQKPTSVGRAAAIMQAVDRAAALRLNETRYDRAQFDGGIAPLDDVPSALVAQLERNTRLMRAFDAPGTPAVIWRDRAGEVHVKVGVPRLSQLPSMTGLSAQVVNDPELAEFR